MVYAITAGFMVFDMLTGLIGSLKNKNFNSSIMREGLFHKCGSILVIALGVLVDYAQQYIDLGVEVPIAVPICVYIIMMEVGSIFENIGKINPTLVPEKIKSRFFKLKGDE